MQLTATYQELSSYIQARFGQPVTLSAALGWMLRAVGARWLEVRRFMATQMRSG